MGLCLSWVCNTFICVHNFLTEEKGAGCCDKIVFVLLFVVFVCTCLISILWYHGLAHDLCLCYSMAIYASSLRKAKMFVQPSILTNKLNCTIFHCKEYSLR